MEVQNDKKWFIYLLDHHEGPFSSDDIVAMIRQGRATSSHYVWRDGMADWEVLSTLSDFQGRLEPTLGGVNPRFVHGTGASSVGGTQPVQAPESVTSEPTMVMGTDKTSTNLKFEPAVAASTEAAPAAEPIPVVEAVPALEAAPVAEPAPVLESAAPAPSGPDADPGQFSAEPVVAAIAVDTIATEAPSAESIAPEAISPEAVAPITAEPTQMTITEVPAAEGTSGYVAPVSGVSREAKAKAAKAPKAPGRIGKILKPVFLGLISVVVIVFVLALTPAGGKLLPAPVTTALAPVTGPVTNLLGRFLSPIPKELKVSAADRAALETAARADVSKDIRLAVALDQEDPTTPFLHVATNLPDGAVVNVYVEGLGETLLNYFEFTSLSKLVISKKMARTNRLTHPDGKPLPRGKYNVYVYVPAVQNPDVTKAIEMFPDVTATNPKVAANKPKALLEKPMFLGGDEDEVYRTRLNEFHQKVREKAAKEVMELKQFLQALQGQADLSLAKFTANSKGAKSKVQVNEWRKFRLQWTQFSDTMNRQFKAWSDQGYQDVYYADLYAAMKDAGGLIVQMHEAQNRYFEGPDRALSIENKIKVNEAVNQVDAALDHIRKDIQSVGDPMALASGLPKRPERSEQRN